MAHEPWEHRTVRANGLDFHCVVAGDKGPLMVLLHGFPQNWYCWRHQIPELARKFRVVAPDQRGYNDSAKPKGVSAYRIANLVADVEGIIDAFGEKKAVVVGHDWGGVVAWTLAFEKPERVEKLVILNVPHPAIMGKAVLTSPRQMRKSWYIFMFQLPWLAEKFLTAREARNIARMMKGMVHRKASFTREDLDFYRAAFLKPGAAKSTVNWYRAALRDVSRPLGGRGVVRAPVRVIWGEDDVALGKELTYGMERFCAGGVEVKYVPDCSHWVVEEHPEDVTRWILEFAS